MNPLRLKATNLGRFETLDVEIPTGCVALTGPNGAGKSTILNAIELALFADGSRDLAGCLSPWADRLELELEFDHAGETYRVRRGYKVGSGGRGSATLDLEQRWVSESDYGHGLTMSTSHAEGWNPLTREKTDATQALICEILGMSRRTFNASAFLGQGNAAAFPDASPADRKAMLGEILDPRGLWPALAERARSEARAVEQTLTADSGRITEREQLVGEIPAVAQQLAGWREPLKVAEQDMTDAEQKLEHAQAALAANATAAERVKAAAVDRDHAQAAVTVARDAAGKATDAAALLPPAEHTLTELEVQAARVPELERSRDELQQARHAAEVAVQEKREKTTTADRLDADVARIRAEGHALDERHRKTTERLEQLRHAEDGHERCDRCQQILGAEARAAAVESLEGEVVAILRESTEKVAVFRETSAQASAARAAAEQVVIPAVPEGSVDAELVAARGAAERLPAQRLIVQGYTELAGQVDELTERLRATVAVLEEKEQALTVASAGVADEAELARSVNDARLTVTGRRNVLDGARAAVVRCEQRLEDLRKAETELADLRRATAARQSELDLLKFAERVFGRDGIPVLLVESVVPLIEAEANRILEQMPTTDGVVFRLALETQRALKSSDGVKETLDILVSDPDGARAYETFSGGERARLNIALRIALARLLANRRGAESRLLAIDELEYLDELGQERLVDVIRSVADDFDRVLVVSHSPNVRDAFDSVIEISKHDGVSRITAAAREAVPA